jgi:endonuclease/exonuclease/phosphatase family metal-dependent hydrolase
MVAFEKPPFTFSFSIEEEKNHLRNNKAHRGIPDKNDRELLVATWNIANLGLHQRADDHYQLIAEILSWFDIIAIQEVHDNLDGLYRLETYIGSEYDLMFNDKGGNDERAAYFYDANKVERLQMTGELAIPPSEFRWIKLPGVNYSFAGFDRNPFIASFQFRNTRFVLLNVHLFFGSESQADMDRRALEAYAVGRYADLRRDDVHRFSENIIALGDFNIPMATPGDEIYDALSKRGLKAPEHSTRMGSSIMSDAQYDQVMFFPSLKRKIQNSGVFDYDRSLFPELWNQRPADFNTYCRYYISDHRPLWVQVRFEED